MWIFQRKNKKALLVTCLLPIKYSDLYFNQEYYTAISEIYFHD